MGNLEQQTALFKALSDTNRLGILEMLSCGELCACKLLAHLFITQPTLSHHMKVLSDCGLVLGRKEGVWMYYCINTPVLNSIAGYMQWLLHAKDNCRCMQPMCCCANEGKGTESGSAQMSENI